MARNVVVGLHNLEVIIVGWKRDREAEGRFDTYSKSLWRAQPQLVVKRLVKNFKIGR